MMFNIFNYVIMNKYLFLLLFVFIPMISHAQNGYVIQNSYQPLSIEEMIVSAKANVNRFSKYQDEAYECFNKGDYNGFIYYSDFALKTGYYNAKMYYNRGVSYEKLHNYSKAKKEYNKALKKGYYEAKPALEQCKINERNWKRNH